jgi:hypothetical protein
MLRILRNTYKQHADTLCRRPTMSVAVSHVHQPPNLPNKTWLGLLVTAPPNAGEYILSLYSYLLRSRELA